VEKKKTVPATSRSNFRLLSISFLLGIAVVYPFLKYALVEPWLFSYEGGDFTIYYKAAQRLTAGVLPIRWTNSSRLKNTAPVPFGASTPIRRCWLDY